MKRTLYIGDVHGCADELEKIIDAFGFVKGTDTLYQTGDIINKGPDMMRAIKLVLDLGIKTVRGNHEEHLIRTMNTPESEWNEKQKNRFSKLSMEEWIFIRDVVQKWPLWRNTPYALLVHAGLEPGKSKLEDMDPKVLLSIRKWNDKPWYEQVCWPKTIVFGHWAKMGFVCRPGFIGLDTGCVYGKYLTAWCPEEDKFYQIPAFKEYTPIKDKTKESENAPCKVLGDSKENTKVTFDSIKREISLGNLKASCKEDEIIQKASPSISAEWAGYV